MSTEQLPDGLQLAVNIIREAEWPEGAGGNPLDAVLNEHAQRLTLQHHACDLAQRVADLEAERDEWKRIASAYSTQKELSTALEQAKASRRQARKERDTLRAKYDELLVALHGIGAALGIPEGDRSPYSVTCGVLERVNRPAEIEAQEPLFYYRPIKGGSMYEGPHWAKSVGGQMLREEKPGEWKPLYARPVPAQAVPDADAARYRWLKTRPIDAPTNGPDLALWSDSCGDALRGDDADAAIDAAMAAAPEHKA